MTGADLLPYAKELGGLLGAGIFGQSFDGSFSMGNRKKETDIAASSSTGERLANEPLTTRGRS
jgi:hypothetical protein